MHLSSITFCPSRQALRSTAGAGRINRHIIHGTVVRTGREIGNFQERRNSNVSHLTPLMLGVYCGRLAEPQRETIAVNQLSMPVH